MTLEALLTILGMMGAVAIGTATVVMFVADRFRKMEDRLLKMITQNRRNADAQFHAIALRLLRVELKLGISDVLPGSGFGDNSQLPDNGNGNGDA